MTPAGPRRSSGTSWWNAVLVPSATSSGRVGSPRPTRLIGRRWRTPTMTMRWCRRWSVRAISTYWSPAGGDRHPANPSGSTACTERWSPGRSTGPGSDMDTTIGERLARHFAGLDYERIPPKNVADAKQLVLDYLGVAIAGSQTESGRIAREFAVKTGGVPEATLIPSGQRVPALHAAFANAIAAHSIELDDVDVLALFHFSPPVVSAALATAERVKASGRDFIAAVVAGCEMMARLSEAVNPALRDRGFHTTPSCGVFGAAVAAGRLLRLDAAGIVSALGLAGAQASGLMEMYGPSMQKRFNPRPAAPHRITAAGMARIGFTGADTIFEGEHGFLRAFTDTSDASQLVDALDRPYQLDIEFKPYSCARPIHNAIDCALEIRSRHQPALDAIQHIEMARHPDWAHYHQNKPPQTYRDAQVSLPYSIAVALKEGQALLKQYSDRKLKDPVLRHISDVTDVTVDASLPRG